VRLPIVQAAISSFNPHARRIVRRACARPAAAAGS
jgi:hypothetical protein